LIRERLLSSDPGAFVAYILIVDDDDLLRGALHKTLVRAGHDVEDAPDGMAALQAFGRQRCDVVITDIVMPQAEGLDMIRTLRRLDPEVKIIAISGGGVGKAGDYLDMAKKFGATRVLAKPFSGAEIAAAVSEVLAAP
jgi:DNA-binding response OmpR family regulator